MEYFQLRSPWEQMAAQAFWDEGSVGGLPWSVPEFSRPRIAKSCWLWFPMWYGIQASGLNRGARLSRWNSRLYGVLWKRGPWLDMPYIVAGNWHVASVRFQRALDNLVPKKIQWLPFRLRDAFGKKLVRKYAVANYLESKDVVDREQSQLEEGARWQLNSGGDFSLRKLVLSRRLIGDSRLFCIHGCKEVVVIGENLRDALERAHVTGCSFGPLFVK